MGGFPSFSKIPEHEKDEESKRERYANDKKMNDLECL